MECTPTLVSYFFCILPNRHCFSKVFLQHALEAGKICDDIVDEHSLLLFIDFSANRCRRDRRGEYIPGTRIGAVRTFLYIMIIHGYLTLILG